jgi:hypothetical protein
MIVRRLTTTAGGLALCALLVGCGGDGRPACHPVTGKVLVDGKPAVRAVVAFHPLAPQADGQSYGPSTITGDDGGFRLTTFDAGDGAPAGEYAVTVVATYVVKGGQDVAVSDLLGGRYADPKTTPLKVTVKEGDNVLQPFDLKSR